MLRITMVLMGFLSFLPCAIKAQHDCKENYFNTPKTVKKLKPLFDFMDLKKGSFIASIGANSGWFEAATSVYYDSLTFYLEDISTECLNEPTIKNTLKLYEKIKKQPINNKFELVRGTDSTTVLPSKLFDRVLMNISYHHFSKKKNMLADIKRIMKPDGFVYVFEIIIFENEKKKYKCPYYTNEQTLISEFKEVGFQYLEKYTFGDGSYFFKFKYAPTN
jgi:ubiquinone/menaquinone biosynthesis C-methylase UbiE